MKFDNLTRRSMLNLLSLPSTLMGLGAMPRALAAQPGGTITERGTYPQGVYPQTAAERAAGVTPSNTSVPSHAELGYVSADRYGADPTGSTDATAIIQGALDVGGVGSTVMIPAGSYRINGTLNKYAGQVIRGSGWATTPLTFRIEGGTVLRQYSHADIPMIQTRGTSDNTQIERGGLRDIALVHDTLGASVGTGYLADYARQELISNVYIASFARGMVFANVCWLCQVEHCRVMDFTKAGLVQQSSSEDNLFLNCQFSGYHPQSVAAHFQNDSANTTFINCYFQGCNYGVHLDQYDSRGDGTGTPYPMHATFIGCLVEDIVQAAFVLSSTVSSPPNGNQSHPGITVSHLRAYNSGNFAQTRQVTRGFQTGGIATLEFDLVPASDAPPVGSRVIVSDVSPEAYNGEHIVTASTPNSVSFRTAATGSASHGKIVYGALPNNGQSLIYARNASQISVQDVYAQGFSHGATIMGTTFRGPAGEQYGMAYRAGSPVGPILWMQDNNSNYGSARFQGVTANITRIPGDSALSRLKSSQLRYHPGEPAVVPFNEVVSDFWGWADTVQRGWVPLRSQTIRFRAQIYIDSAPIGRYSLTLRKNGKKIAMLSDLANSTDGAPMLLSGEFDDVPDGVSDTYGIFVESTASWLLNTDAGNTWATAQIVGD